VALALAMVIGRFLPIIAVLAIAGTFAAQRPGVNTAGTLRTHSPTFIVLIVSATLLIVGLEYLPHWRSAQRPTLCGDVRTA
jgi:potassium-transporting ATPase potassium-binding subunit